MQLSFLINWPNTGNYPVIFVGPMWSHEPLKLEDSRQASESREAEGEVWEKQGGRTQSSIVGFTGQEEGHEPGLLAVYRSQIWLTLPPTPMGNQQRNRDLSATRAQNSIQPIIWMG